MSDITNEEGEARAQTIIALTLLAQQNDMSMNDAMGDLAIMKLKLPRRVD